MKIQCPECGVTISVNALGRKPSKVTVTEVCDALQLYRSVSGAASSLECSRAYIYKVLKTRGKMPADVIKGKATLPDTIHLEHIL